MPLTGQAKTDYMREYMRKRRSNPRSNTKPVSVRPKTTNVRPEGVRPKADVRPVTVRPPGLSDNQWAYIQMKAEDET